MKQSLWLDGQIPRTVNGGGHLEVKGNYHLSFSEFLKRIRGIGNYKMGSCSREGQQALVDDVGMDGDPERVTTEPVPELEGTSHLPLNKLKSQT